MLKFFRIPFATSGDKTAVPDAIDASGYVSYTEGYGSDYELIKTDPNSKNVEREKQNELFFDITTAIAEIQSQGVPDFITSALNGGTAYSYSINAMVRYNNDIYVSLANTNTALPTDTTKWALLPTPDRVRDGYNTVAVSGGTANAITLTLTPTQTGFANGAPTWWRATAANTTTTPTLQRDALAAKTIVKGNNLPLAAGDIPGAGCWMCSSYDATLGKEVLLNPATGVTVTTQRKTAQIVQTATGTVSSFTSAATIPKDNTIPQITEGALCLTRAITPTNASSTLRVTINVMLAHSAAGGTLVAALFQDSTANALAVEPQGYDSSNKPVSINFVYTMTAGTTSSTSFTVRCGCDQAGDLTLNGASGSQLYGGVAVSNIIIEEILP